MKIKNVQIGQEITVKEGENKHQVLVTYEVYAIYPHHVLVRRYCPDADVYIRRSISYGDLVQLGLEAQEQ